MTLGLHLGLLGKTPPPPRPIHDLIEYVKRLYDAITCVQSDHFERSPADVARSVLIDDLGLPPPTSPSPKLKRRR